MGEGVQKIWKSKISYSKSLSMQEELKVQARKSQKAFFLGFESSATITLGLRGKLQDDIQISEEECKGRGLEIVSIKRGGQATIHSPGQLVIYPILDLREWKIKPRDFLHLLENITKITFKKYDLLVEKKENSAGLFTDHGKIVFFGIHISEGVNQHGLSINVSNDLNLFKLIRSCGKIHRHHDSFRNRGIDVALKDLFFSWCETAQKNLFHNLESPGTTIL